MRSDGFHEVDPDFSEETLESTISHDGKQFLIRLPNKLFDLYGFEKGDRFIFEIRKPTLKSGGKISGRFVIQKKRV